MNRVHLNFFHSLREHAAFSLQIARMNYMHSSLTRVYTYEIDFAPDLTISQPQLGKNLQFILYLHFTFTIAASNGIENL